MQESGQAEICQLIREFSKLKSLVEVPTGAIVAALLKIGIEVSLAGCAYSEVTMRVLLNITVFVMFSSLLSSNASAECYGDAAQMYDCAPSTTSNQSNTGTLVSFGEEPSPVIPERRGAPVSFTDNLFSPEEYRGMMRSIVRGHGSQTYSRASELQAMNRGARPLRRSGNTRVTVYGR